MIQETSSDKAIADVTVITAAYSVERWPLTIAAVESVLAQTIMPREIILPVDHNPDLLKRLSDYWAHSHAAKSGPSILVVESRYDGHLGASATTAAQLATSEFLAFLDDDAAADPDWLAQIIAPFRDPSVIAVGGAPLPIYSRPRPVWFPHEFDWVFGCAYAGLPIRRAPILHLIGTTMAVRRSDLLAIGGIHSNDHGDMEMSHRLLERAPDRKLIYEPDARVRHYVHPNRLTWSYFWRRCFLVNRSKVAAMREMGSAAHLRAERTFAGRVLTHGVRTGLSEFVRGDVSGMLRAIAICVGVGLAGAGYAIGRIEWRLGYRPRGNSSGWIGSLGSTGDSDSRANPTSDA
jgi:GT2 family glycosyltransferase